MTTAMHCVGTELDGSAEPSRGKTHIFALPSLLMALAAARLVEMKFGHRVETLIGAGPEGLIAITCADKSLLRPVAALMGTLGPAIGHE